MIRTVLLAVLAFLVQVPTATTAHAFPVFVGDKAPCISAGDVIALPAEYDGCVSSAVTQLSETEWNFAYEGEFVPTIVPDGGGDFVIPPLIDLVVIEIDSILSESDIFNPSTGYEGVGVLNGIYGVLFRIDAMGFNISFETSMGPRVGQFFAVGSDGGGGEFTLSSTQIYTPGSVTVPEPATLTLALFGGLALAMRKRSSA